MVMRIINSLSSILYFKETLMSNENRFFNFHMESSCANNSKIGFQSLNSDVAALKKSLGQCRDWADQGTLKDGDVLVIYAKYTETDAAEEMSLSELKLADGTTRPVTPAEPEAEAAEPETEDEAEGTIPF
jgi:hypothetical protein